ncbi:GreA/GreB family elongation factor [Stutzerimonas stutzeri]|uniref:GreA/GreB family elongation factor n=1 Tax=Stutzerimonas stutzeri TaxID=316 RepID=UPI002109FB1A|nr:GreA/GreB family elongation factor [Stutzerimonas stutzeri]MCQ4259816.1 GreA/GreB family elongation factor [Stutzerimonas stutzeri]
MNKSLLHTLIIEQLQADLKIAKDALQASHEAATHAESKAENKYDTRGLEAAYLADGQRRRVHEIEVALAGFRNLPIRAHLNEPISLGALIELEGDGGCRWVFLGPDAAGLCVVIDSTDVLLISPRSPLGQALMNLYEGDELEISVNSRAQRYAVVSVI